ncbi:hypothetical protein C8F01DRAFT_1251682 [Mycena amicta]|nr:hypothetical protein C8F01DRAFT_1251682 [Mycena amicta]
MANKAEGDLLDLLLQLKRTTPQAAKQLLNSQPAIAYALISLMVSMNAIDIDVFQKTLASHSAPAPAVPPAPSPLSAIPPHLQPSSRTNTPPVQQPYPQHYGGYPNAPSHTPTPPNAYPGYSGYAPPAVPTPPPPPQRPAPPTIPDAMFAGMSEEQKQMLVSVLSMTPEQINALPPSDRTHVIQLRATLGLR